MPKVSVLMPVYNNTKYLPEAIESVLTQSMEDFELIIVDDCSSENVQEVVSRYQDRRIQFHRNQRNLGLIMNTNLCIKYAKGEYIKFIDSDDILHPEALARQATILDTYLDVSIVSGDYQIIDSGGRETKLNNGPLWGYINGLKAIKYCIQHGNKIGPPSAVMVRQVTSPKMFYEYPHLCDLSLELDVLKVGDLFVIPVIVCKYRVHSGQEWSKGNHKWIFPKDYARMYHEYKRYLNKKEKLVAAKNNILIVPACWNTRKMYSFTRMTWETIKQVKRILFKEK